jgi:hypothetical protein
MDKDTRGKPGLRESAERKAPDDDKDLACTRPFYAENARSEDKDQPCKDGVG